MVISQTRIYVQWSFHEIKSYLKFVSLKSQMWIGRSSHQRCSVRKGVFGNLAKFIWKHLCNSLFFNKVSGLRHKYFSVNFEKFLRVSYLQNTSGRLFLDRIKCSWQNLLCMCLTAKSKNMVIKYMGIKFFSFSSSFA